MSPLGTVLVGAGVVGRAILRSHIDNHVSIHLVDQDGDAIRRAIAELELDHQWSIGIAESMGDSLIAVSIRYDGDAEPESTIVIESIAERLDVKQTFFADAEKLFGKDAVFCSNTSTLRIGTIAASLDHPERFAGMHFFMPVNERPAVEIIRGAATSNTTIERCVAHVRRLCKEPLVVADSPGFIVNRLLSPYLNQAMLLLCHGVAADRIERAALQYGMPMSPMELIDTIGTRTTFDAGRIYWQSFPSRIDPAPMLGKLIKGGRLGKAVQKGFYDYADGKRSTDLAFEVKMLIEGYFRPLEDVSDTDLVHLLAIPMWIEAAAAHREGTVQSLDQFDKAMRGGLGYAPNQSWMAFFNSLGNDTITRAVTRWKPKFKSMDPIGIDLMRFDCQS